MTRKVVDLGIAAWSRGVKGFHGLHLEGPHLFAGRKGAHDPNLIRPLNREDMALYLRAARELPSLIMTVAPETVPPEQMRELVDAGIHVSLGHSGCTALRLSIDHVQLRTSEHHDVHYDAEHRSMTARTSEHAGIG